MTIQPSFSNEDIAEQYANDELSEEQFEAMVPSLAGEFFYRVSIKRKNPETGTTLEGTGHEGMSYKTIRPADINNPEKLGQMFAVVKGAINSYREQGLTLDHVKLTCFRLDEVDFPIVPKQLKDGLEQLGVQNLSMFEYSQDRHAEINNQCETGCILQNP